MEVNLYCRQVLGERYDVDPEKARPNLFSKWNRDLDRYIMRIVTSLQKMTISSLGSFFPSIKNYNISIIS